MNLKDIHIGNIIKEIVVLKEIDIFKICKYLNLTEKEVHHLYDSKSLDSELLLKISKLIKYDLFRVYTQHILFYDSISNSKTFSQVKESKIPVFKKNIYTKEIIEFIIELIVTKTKTSKEITAEYGIPKTTVYNWIRKYKYGY